jgi:HAD superfamily hydrolase (TIGR01549 family)
VKLQSLIFDIDGTLVDSNDIHAHCWVEAFAHFDKHIDYDVMRGQMGKGGDLLVPDLLNAREMRKFGDELKDYRAKLFKKKYLDDVKPFAYSLPLFEKLHARGFKLALASSSNPDEVEYYTRLLGVEKLIAGSTSKEDAEHSKPSPEIFQAALEQAGCDPEFTFTVGDTPYDVLASHRIALPIVAVLSGGFPRGQLAKAEFLFADAGRIIERIDEIDAWFEA